VRKFRTDHNGVVKGGNEVSTTATKIVFLGGPTTECNEVAEPFRFPALVERLLRERGLNIVTLNAGVRGHTTQDSINALLILANAADKSITTDDVVRMFLQWINMYSELHFAVIASIYNDSGVTRARIAVSAASF
jgi:hypothetical protein